MKDSAAKKPAAKTAVIGGRKVKVATPNEVKTSSEKMDMLIT